MKKFIFFVALFSSLITHSFAESYEETYARFAEVARIDDMFNAMIDEQNLAEVLEQQVLQVGVDMDKKVKVHIVSAVREILQKAKIEYDKYIFEAYKKHYSQGELAELIAFYTTPIGKKMAKLQSTLTKEGAIAGERIMSKYQPLLIEKLQKALE